MQKTFNGLLAFALFFSTQAAFAELSKKWELSEGLMNPESVLFVSELGGLVVSNVAGVPNNKDKQGWLSLVGLDGKMKEAQWISGLNAPKGLASAHGKIWVADIDQVVEVTIATKTVRKIAVPGAKFLNDAVFDVVTGMVLVTDTMTGKIHGVKGRKVTTWMKLKGWAPNGILATSPYIFVAAWGKNIKDDFSVSEPGRVLMIHRKGQKVEVMDFDMTGSFDGLESTTNSTGRILTDWSAGKVYRLDKSNKMELLVQGLSGAADIGVVGSEIAGSKSPLLVVPEMNTSKLHAYEL